MTKGMAAEARAEIEARRCPDPNGCWLWHESGAQGYGTLGFYGKKWLAHRLAWAAYKGTIPKGLHVLHKCDVRQCCNPDHLSLGTHQENMADMMRKGRNWHGANWNRAIPWYMTEHDYWRRHARAKKVRRYIRLYGEEMGRAILADCSHDDLCRNDCLCVLNMVEVNPT